MPFITDDGSFCYDIPQDVIRVYVSIRFWPINRLWYFGGGLFLDIWNLRTAIFPDGALEKKIRNSRAAQKREAANKILEGTTTTTLWGAFLKAKQLKPDEK